MGDLISVIIPIYNSEQYIRGCIESVLMQTYSAFEVILIEDGSEDDSLKVCEVLCKKDKRIKLLKQEHKGVSAARNLGIEASEGKYLFFLDSDDLIHPQLLELLYKLLEEKQTDIATEGLYYSRNNDCRKTIAWKTIDHTPKSYYLDNNSALKYMNKVAVCAIGGKMIARSAIKSIRFVENLSHCEDKLFIYRLLVNGADVTVLGCNWYFYRRHEDCVSKNFSPEACKTRYRVDRFICNHEMQSGRRDHAVYREWNIVVMLSDWYITGRMNHDLERIKYVEKLARGERKRKIFHQLNWWMKLAFYSVFYCYPFSMTGIIVLRFIKKRLGKRM